MKTLPRRKKTTKTPPPQKSRIAADRFFAAVDKAMHEAAKDARKIAKMHGTPIAIIKHGKIAAEKP